MTVSYAGSSILTSDAVATGVLEYAAQLARAATAETLVVPGVQPDGTPTVLELLIGPSSQMTARPAADELPVDDAAFLAELERRSRPVHGSAVEDAPDLRFFEDY